MLDAYSAPSAPVEGENSERGTSRIRTLVAMEQPLFAEVLRIALTDRGGYDVVGTCTSLPELCTMVERCRADVVLMDVQSDECDGLAVLRELREAQPDTAVLVVTAMASPEVLSEAMTHGAAGCLSFDADVSEVISAVRSAAEGKVVLSGTRLEALVRHLVRRSAVTPPSGPGGRLTDREVEVLRLLASGASTEGIARGLFISTHTARTHVQNVLMKLGVHSRLEAAAYAVRNGLATQPTTHVASGRR
ncbi:MAG: response regulator transcription factor [Actinomycetota bacterium]|nr:response regulator transcription factor [Actinomycetota bacterium]